jgi:parvulin-like peptidyl-prolyl isomerase
LKFQKRTLRLVLIVAVTAAVSFPLFNQLRNTRAIGQTPDTRLLPTQAKPEPVVAFPLVDPAKVVLSIGDEKVTAGEFTAFFSDLDPQLQARILAHPESKRQLAEQYIDMKLMAAEAKKQKLDETIAFKTTYDQLLANALMVSLSKEKDANTKFYTDNKDYFSELQARHILIGVAGGGIDSKLTDVQAKAKADELKKRLDKGEDFAAIARTESDDKGSAATGGNLGMMQHGQMVPAFEQAAYALKDNEISAPVKTQFGYHIIQVLSRSTPPYDQVADRIPRRRLELMVEQMKKVQKPEIDDAFFSPTVPRPGATTKPSDAPVVK